MRSLGIDLEKREYIILADLSPAEVGDLLSRSLMWLETINETLSTAKKLFLDQSLETEKVTAEIIRSFLSKEEGYKVTDARAAAKVHPRYLEFAQKLNTLDAYVDYLERLIDNLNKYHYTVKGRVDKMEHVERKYRA